MPIKSFFKLYSIPLLIVIAGICLYYVIFISIKDKNMPYIHQKTTTQTPQKPTQEPIIVFAEEIPQPMENIENTQNPTITESSETQNTQTLSSNTLPQGDIMIDEVVRDSQTKDIIQEATISQPTQEPHIQTPLHNEHYVYVNVRSANIRALPNIESPILQRANNGQKLKLIQTLPQSEWSEVEIAPNTYGYIASYLLSDQEPQYDLYQVIVKSANIRALPSENAPIIASVGYEHNVRVMQNDEGWAKILLENGQEGYIASRLLKK